MPKKSKHPGLWKPKGGHWQIRKTVVLPGVGKRVLRGSTGTSDPKIAEKVLRERVKQAEQEIAFGLGGRIYTWDDARKRMLHERPTPFVAYCIDTISNHIAPETALALINNDHDGVRAIRALNLSPKTINEVLGMLASCLRRASAEWYDPETNRNWIMQASHIGRVKRDRKKSAHVLTYAEQERLLKALPAHLARMTLFGLHTGLREQNICKAEWAWYREIDGIPVLDIPGEAMKMGKRHVIPLNRTARSLIGQPKGKWIFPYGRKPRKKSASPEELSRPLYRMHSRAWNDAWAAAGLPDGPLVLAGPHNLRHTFATRLRDLDAPEADISALMAHAKQGVTQGYTASELGRLYGHVCGLDGEKTGVNRIYLAG